MCIDVRVVCVLVSESVFLLLLALGGAVCDVVEAGAHPGQVQQGAGRLLHLLVVALWFLQRGRRAPLLQGQSVADAPRFAFGPGQTAPGQCPGPDCDYRPGACATVASLCAQGILGNEGCASDV